MFLEVYCAGSKLGNLHRHEWYILKIYLLNGKSLKVFNSDLNPYEGQTMFGLYLFPRNVLINTCKCKLQVRRLSPSKLCLYILGQIEILRLVKFIHLLCSNLKICLIWTSPFTFELKNIYFYPLEKIDQPWMSTLLILVCTEWHRVIENVFSHLINLLTNINLSFYWINIIEIFFILILFILKLWLVKNYKLWPRIYFEAILNPQ